MLRIPLARTKSHRPHMSKISSAATGKHGNVRFCEYMWRGSEQTTLNHNTGTAYKEERKL